MNETHISTIAEEQNIKNSQVLAVADLLGQGATIPFIARYRKEVTNSLDEVSITGIRDRLNQLKEITDRKETILNSLKQHGHHTDELEKKVIQAPTMAILEDIYLPYKPKRKTKATVAKEKGLEPLAHLILEQKGIDPVSEAGCFVDSEKGVESADDALSGARDIIAEIINEDEQVRAAMRRLYTEKSVLKSRVASGKKSEGVKYKDYFEWEESAIKAPSHRILAMRRGEKEDILNLDIAPDEEEALNILETLFVKSDAEDSSQVKTAAHDCYKRLLSRSMETEIRLATKKKADSDAIKIFAENLRQLLLASPLGPKRVMGIDPGFRTGCKVVCLDRQGKLLENDTIYPHTSEKKKIESAHKVKSLCNHYRIEAIAVGNGTAGRETEAFIKELPLSETIQIILVNEAGASIYSASEVAREEFPDHDLTVRGSVSIGRRLMDPLSELVKIDPKSIGVGQYQHDVDQTALKEALDDIVMSCVNGIGVDLNRASVQLLTYVSGLGPRLAKNIVAHRNENGPFSSRKKLVDVPRLGPKAFEQSAGFLRVSNSENPLDSSAVHPESYHIVETMAADLNCTVSDIVDDSSLRDRIDISRYISDTTGIPTLKDIIEELAKPGRDPRDAFEAFSFADGIEKIQDLRSGMKLPGIVTNITAFGAFVDIGVHQDGLVHISEMADRFVKDPVDVVKVHQNVLVTVLDVDLERKRISLSMKTGKKTAGSEKKRSPVKDAGIQGKNKQRIKKQPQQKNNSEKKHPAFHNPFAEFFNDL